MLIQIKAFILNITKGDFLGTRVHYAYNTYKIIDQDEAELEASNNPFAMAVLSAKLALSRPIVDDQQLFDMAYNLAKRLLAKQIPKEKIRKVMSFLRYYLSFESPEMFSKFEKEISILTERKVTMGIEEFLLDRAEKKGEERGEKKGIEKGVVLGVELGVEKGVKKTALEMKKKGSDFNFISSVTGLSMEEIEKLQ